MINKIWTKIPLGVRLTGWYILLLAFTLIIFSSYLYVQLQRSLSKQLDATLKISAFQAINDLIEPQNYHAFKKSSSSENVINNFAQIGLGLRLVSSEGDVWDGIGHYQSIPIVPVKKTGYITINNNKQIWRVYNYPLPSNQNISVSKKNQAWIQVIQSLNSIQKTSDHLLLLMVLSIIPILIVTALGGLFLAQRALSPINRMIRIAEGITANDFTQRINYEGSQDIIGKLATTFDNMLAHIQQAFEYEKQFSANAAHELRTPLTIIKGKIEVTLTRDRSVQEYHNTLETLKEEVNRLIRLTNNLLFLTRLDEIDKKQDYLENFYLFNLTNLLEILSEQIEPLANDKQININCQIDSDLMIFGNSDYLTNLFLNLLDNAIKYTPKQENIFIFNRIVNNYLYITIKNTGVSIDSEQLPYLFKRFYRVPEISSQSSTGEGLGLAIAYQIARLHGGDITVSSQKNKSTTFTVQLPYPKEN